MRAEFSEREFEFCFNSEFIRRQPTGCLATALIPSQRREGKLGYDVELRVSNGEFTRSAFVQHKVPHLLSRWGRSTGQLLNLHGGPYYRFEIYSSKKSQQHELLWSLARSGQRVYYCAPKATASEALQRLVASNTVVDQSVRVDLRGLPLFRDDQRHHLTYNDRDMQQIYSSDPAHLEPAGTWDELFEPHHGDPLTFGELAAIYDHLIEMMRSHNIPIENHRPSSMLGVISAIADLVSRQLDASWLLLP